METYVYMQ